jgi:hypothetical protein
VNCPDGQIFNSETGGCECPEQQHWTGKVCVICPDGSFWNELKKECQTCGEEEEFDPELKTCVECPTGFILNKETHKCEKYKFSSGMEEICVEDEAPYFDG